MLIEPGLDPGEGGVLLTYGREKKFVVMQMHQSDDNLDKQGRSYAMVISCLSSSELGGEEKRFGDASLFVSRHFGTEQLSSAASLDSCT